MVEICFIYTLKLGIGGRLSISVHSPRLQFVTGLPNSPKTEAKGVVLARGLWYQMPGSLGLTFDVNTPLCSQVCLILVVTHVLLGGSCTDIPLFS